MAEPRADRRRRAAAPAAPATACCSGWRASRRCATRCCSWSSPAVWLFFYFATNGTFLTQRNLVLLALQTSIVSLAAISAVMLIVTRNFDLSVGSAVALVGVILALLTVKHDVNPALAVLAAIAGGVLMGAWQGFWVTRVGVSSFIVTLAGMLYFRGISMIVTNGATVAPLPRSLTGLATGFLPPAWSIARRPRHARRLRRAARRRDPPRRGAGRRRAGWRPSCSRALAAPAVVAAARDLDRLLAGHALSRAAGRALHAGGRVRHAPHPLRRAALRHRRQPGGGAAGRHQPRAASIFWNFVIAGLGYGITGVALTARVSGAIGGSAGLFLELDAIAAAIIGGTSLAGGRGRVLGALLGALLMGSLNNGMSLMNVPTFYQDTARGIVLLLAVAIDQLSRRKS